MIAWRDTLDRYGSELADNARLRVGLWAVLMLAILYGVMLQADRLDAAYDDYGTEADRFTRVEASLASGDWQDWLREEQDSNERLAARLWRADTPGLAQANLQATLNEITEGLELRDARVRPGVSQPAPGAPGVWRVQMQFTASYRRGAELQVLHRLATYPRKLVVDRLDLSRNNDRLRLILSAYFLGVGAEDA